MRDRCGVIGLWVEENQAALDAYYGLYALQHRGQEGAGIVSYDGFRFHMHKDRGLVGDVFSPEDLEDLQGHCAIGHVRYPTYGSLDSQAVHPFTVSTKEGSLALGHNGNLTNAEELRAELERKGHVFTSDADTEVMLHELARNLLQIDFVSAFEKTFSQIDGAYSATLLANDRLVGVRDPYGVRPLCIGKLKGGYLLASESVAIDSLGGEFIRDVRPGEMVVVDEDGLQSHQLLPGRPAHCFFEYVYFARPDSTIEGRSVYETRRELGQLLCKNYGVKADLASPVPDSGRAFASGYAEAGEAEFIETIMKNRYIGRTFIMPTQQDRERAVRLKLNPIASNVEDKSLTIIDDSIVRGTTSRQLIESLRCSGANEVHMRVGSPPIVSPCHLGINMATTEELLADDKSLREVKDMIGADSLKYLAMSEVAQAIDIPEEELCTGCIGGDYPV
ncbi:MAG: amidophosphoribosyltransferase [Candidatus Bipolaricaulia bacterium]